MRTILVSTYAVNPYKGSEDGMGWNYISQVARFNRVIAVTRKNNRPHIESFMKESPSKLYDNMEFLYFDTPYWTRFWKKGGRGAMLYYWMWQRALPSFIRKQGKEFDIVHNLNFHNDWTPSYLWKLKKPFVWGPVGHHPLIPSQFLKPYSIKYLIKDRATWLVKLFFWNLSFALRSTVKHSDMIWCMNSSVPPALKLTTERHIIGPSIASENVEWLPLKEREGEKFTLLSAGRLVPLKGFDLTILSFAEFVNKLPIAERKQCELIIVGKGPEEGYYQQLTKESGVSEYVRFIPWIERSELMKIFKTSTIFLFPSHEGAGMVVPEALSYGLPVICLDNIGPGEFITPESGFKAPVGTIKETIASLSSYIEKLFHDRELLEKMSFGARKHFENKFDWSRRGEILNEIYTEIAKGGDKK